MACQEVAGACLEKVKANPEKMKAGLKGLETREDVFEERLDTMDAARKACLGNMEASQEMTNVVAYPEALIEEMKI
jgi:hypothetical protein